ncbi:acyl carrier protein [Aestuariivirga sp.]|uniref:acyl carrier protein n=1 Tax=Aestuariivirga sp. TaxID=2650926 RepID=UPI00359316F1
MSSMQPALATSFNHSAGHFSAVTDIPSAVMSVLRDIRPLQSNGLSYDVDTGLADAGFTSVEMVNVMLGIEAAFDLMIPQEMITPENFMDARAITRMVEHLTQAS